MSELPKVEGTITILGFSNGSMKIQSNFTPQGMIKILSLAINIIAEKHFFEPPMQLTDTVKDVRPIVLPEKFKVVR